MEWMSDWIRQIVLILFIATFIDLILPSSSLERYVKLVMGLIIIMAILQPILHLILKEDSWNKIAASFSTMESMPTMASFEEIKTKSKQINQIEQAEIKQQFQISIVNWTTKQVSRKFHVKVVSAKVIVGQQNQTPIIHHITVVATETPESSTKSIKPIQAVDIGTEPAKPTSSSQDTKLQTEIRQYIEDEWDLVNGQVEVRVTSS